MPQPIPIILLPKPKAFSRERCWRPGDFEDHMACSLETKTCGCIVCANNGQITKPCIQHRGRVGR